MDSSYYKTLILMIWKAIMSFTNRAWLRLLLQNFEIKIIMKIMLYVLMSLL